MAVISIANFSICRSIIIQDAALSLTPRAPPQNHQHCRAIQSQLSALKQPGIATALDPRLQDYVRELGICLAIGGEALWWDMGCATGRRMATLHDELCLLCECKATADLESHTAFITSPLLPAIDGPSPAGRTDPDWLKLGVSSQCSARRVHVGTYYGSTMQYSVSTCYAEVHDM